MVGHNSQTLLLAEKIHSVRLSSRCIALLSIPGVSGLLFTARLLKRVPIWSVLNTLSAPGWFLKSPAGICWVSVERLVELANVPELDRPLPEQALVGIGEIPICV